MNLAKAGRRIGADIVQQLRASPEWEQLQDVAKQELTAAGRDLGELLVRQLAGVDNSRELSHARARVLSWAFVEASLAKKLLQEAVKVVLLKAAQAAAMVVA